MVDGRCSLTGAVSLEGAAREHVLTFYIFRSILSMFVKGFYCGKELKERLVPRRKWKKVIVTRPKKEKNGKYL